MPATASAAGQSFSITPCATTVCSPLSLSFYAGGAASVTMVSTLDSGAIASNGGPSLVNVQLAAGFLANVAAAPACVDGGGPQYTTACLVGNGTGTTTLKIPLKFDVYLVPATAPGDVGGLDFVSGKANSKLAHAEIAVVQLPSGAVVAVLRLDLSSLGPLAGLMTSLTVNVNGAVGTRPFIRLPSTNTPAVPSALTVVYGTGSRAKGETTIAAPDVTPTGASSLAYAPKLTGKATKDSTDAGVRLTTTVTQAAGETASRSVALTIPSPELSFNVAAALALLNSGTAVGSATAASPLLPGSLSGQVFLTGSIAAPALTIRFPPPIPLRLTGRPDIATSSLSFSGLPDMPVTQLQITLNGGPQALLQTACATSTGTLSGSFAGYNGRTARSQQPLSVDGCVATRPLRSPALTGGSLRGLAAGHPKLRFTASRGTAAPNVAALAVALPTGLSFDRRALATHRTCSARRRPRCTITRSARGLSLSGGAARRVAFSGGKLIITLRKPVPRLSVMLSRPVLRETKRLTRRVRARRVRTLTVHVRLTDARRQRTTLALRLAL